MCDILIHHYSDINAEKNDRGFIIMIIVIAETLMLNRKGCQKVFGFFVDMN